MKIISKNANFAVNNIGNSNKVETYIKRLSLVDPVMIAALRALYASCKEKGFTSLPIALKLNCHSDPLKDGYNLLDVDTYKTTFINDSSGYHTLNGYTPNGAAQARANSNWPLTTYNMHMHVVHPVGESAGNKFLLSVNVGASTDDSYAVLQRRSTAGNSRGGLGSFTSQTPIGATSSPGEAGVFSIARGSDNKAAIYSNGVLVSSIATQPGVAPKLGNVTFNEGAIVTSDPTSYATVPFFATMYGNGNWTLQNEIDFYLMIKAFASAIGVVIP